MFKNWTALGATGVRSGWGVGVEGVGGEEGGGGEVIDTLETSEAFRPASPWWGAMVVPIAKIRRRDMIGFTKEQLDKMVWDADVASRSIIGEGVLADVCCHVKALAAEMDRMRAENERLRKANATLLTCGGDAEYDVGPAPIFGTFDDRVSESMK